MGYNSPLLAITLLLGMVWLGYASLHPKQHHYAWMPQNKSLAQRQSEALKDLWDISDGEIAKPVNIFEGENN